MEQISIKNHLYTSQVLGNLMERMGQLPLLKKIHTLSRLHICGVVGQDALDMHFTQLVSEVKNIFHKWEEGDIEYIFNTYVLNIYESSKSYRRRNLGKVYSSMDVHYRKTMSIISTLEYVYLYSRWGKLYMIEDVVPFMTKLIDDNATIVKNCLQYDKPKLKTLDGTMYINSLFYLYHNIEVLGIKNISKSFIYGLIKEAINTYIDYEGELTESIVYGITHALIGPTKFYMDNKEYIKHTSEYDKLIEKLIEIVKSEKFSKFSLDLRIECCMVLKLYNVSIDIDYDFGKYMSKYGLLMDTRYRHIAEVEDLEHTNILFVMLNKIRSIV